MKHYTEIMKDIRNNNNKIKELDAKADELLKKADRAAAESFTEKIAIKKSISEEAEAAAIAAYAEIENIKSINSILAENVKASFAAYVIPIIKEIMQKYAGKQYGTKTKEKIREEAKKHSIMFYFDGYREQYKVHVFCLTNEGYTDYNSPEIYINATDEAGHTTAFISESNKIQDINNIVFSNHYTYTEDPNEKRAELEAAYNEFKNLVEQAKAAESKLNALLPESTKHFDIIGYLSPYQKPY